MNHSENISLHGRRLLDRRGFLATAGLSAAGLGLASLLDADSLLAANSRPDIDPGNPYAPRNPHFDMPAKQVLVIYCPGAVSHVDTFDYKPALAKLHGQKPPGIPAVTFEGPTGNIAKPFWDFKPRGQSGKMISDLVPNLAELADDMCFIHSLTAKNSAHTQAENFLSTGFTFEGYPSLGAWTLYGLGSESQDLPGFVVFSTGKKGPSGGSANWGDPRSSWGYSMSRRTRSRMAECIWIRNAR